MIERQLAELPVYTNGGVSYSEAKMMSFIERELMTQVINKKFELSSGVEFL